ncbi:MAG TPA: PGF-pre-PGF domain-containing protein [Methanosarcinaceae archaeon]|nr:PGF-pre-PGF domain-containing protein [Methanosarcinaceae archaeon]
MIHKIIKIGQNTVGGSMNAHRVLILIMAITVCMVSTGVGMAAVNNGSEMHEIRGEVAISARSWNATNCPAFYYDFTRGIGTESLVVSAIDGRNISSGNLIYHTHTVPVNYEVYGHEGILVNGNSSYSLIGWQGERFVALNDNANKLSNIVFEHGRRTLAAGHVWDLGNGYTLNPVQIDVDGDKVWLSLSKNGLEIDSAVVNGHSAWVVTMPLAGEEVPFFVVYVDEIFQGMENSIVVLDHVCLISDNVTYIHTDDEFGNFTVRTVNSSDIVLNNHVQVNLSKGSTPGIMNDLKFRVADSDTMRYYPFVVGDTYYAQGTVADGNYHWDAYNFAGFYFDLDGNISTERLDATVIDRNIGRGKLVYSTKPVTTRFENNEWGSYEVIAFMTKKYFAGYQSGTFGSSDSVDLISDGQLSRVLINEDEKRLVYAGSALILEDGYTLNIVELDTDGDRVYVTLTKDGSKVDDMVLSSGKNYVYEKDLGLSEDVPIIAVHFDEIFQGSENSAVFVNGIFQVSDKYITINCGDTCSRMEVTSITGNEIKMQNSDSIYLYPDEIIPIMGQIQLKVADNDWQLRYYPFVEEQGLSTTINSPARHSTFSQGDMIIFSAYAEGGVAPYSYRWTSDIDGIIENKSRFVTSTLNPGVHSITFSVRDTSGAINNASTTLTVEVKNLLEYNGDAICITGLQEDAIVWNASNFEGFNYSTDGGLGTETLTIAPYTLYGPDTDRLIDPGNLIYTTSFSWREYPIHKDLGLYVNKYDDGYSTGYLNGKQYVAINGVPDKLAIPIVEFNSNDVKILRTGDVWDIGGGFSITAMQIDTEGDKVCIELNKNGVFCEDAIIDAGSNYLQNRVWTYNKDVAGEIDVPILSLYVSGTILGTDNGVGYAQIKYLSLIDDNILQISPEDSFGNMELTSIMGNSLGFSNWIDLDLTPGSSPSMIMENMSFVTLDNLSSIEFYPSMVKDETPIYDMGGFIPGNDLSLWNLSEGYTIALQEVGIKGKKAMFSLLYDGVIIDQKIMIERLIAPNNPDSNYQYIKNGTLIINATLDFVFRGQNSEIVNLINVHQCSEVDGSVLLSNESHFFKSISPTGILWNLSEGYALTMKDVSPAGDKAWFELSKNNLVLKDAILNEDSMNSFIFTSGGDNISFIADTIFSGTNENVVKISNVYQYSNVSGQLISDATHIYKTGDPVGMPWSLPNGYCLSMKDIEDPEGERVWFELSRDGSILKEDIIRSGDLFFYGNDSESFNCTVIGVMCGTMGDVVKIANINLYSDIGENLVQNGSKIYTNAYPNGEIWQLHEGYTLNPRDLDKNGDKIWLSLSKNDMVVKDEIIDSNDVDRWFSYYNSTGALVFNTYVKDIFLGQICGVVILADTTQYSEINGTSLLQVPKKTLSSGILFNDIIPPAITITSPADGSNASTSGITVTGTASDTSGIATVTVNGVLVSGAADWSTEVTLTEGANTITAVATDNAGNQNTTTITVYLVSTSAESLSIGSASAPANSTVTIPVSVAKVTNISGISFDLLYNSSVVIVSNVSVSENFTGSSITPIIDNVNGITSIVLTNLNLISASVGTPVIDIAFNITGGSGSFSTLDIKNVEFSTSFNVYSPYTINGEIIIANSNNAPITSDQSVTTDEDTPINIILSATDVDDDPLAYSIVANPSNGIVYISNNIATYTPDTNYYGADNFTFKANDGTIDSTTATVSITVSAVNDAPILGSIGSKSVDENSTLTFTLASSDGDGDSLTYSAIDLPTGASLDGSSGIFTWAPTYEQAGTYPVQFIVTDGTLNDSETVTITVNNINRAPILNSISTVTISETETATIELVASDPDGDSLTYSTNATFGFLTGNTFTWTSGFNNDGIYYLEFTVNDTFLTDTKIGIIIVGNADHAPVLDSIEPKSVDENTVLTFTLTASDPDNDDLAYSSVDLPEGASLDSSSGLFTWTPTYEQSGIYQVDFVVKGLILTDNKTAIITVNNINRAPVANDDTSTTLEDTSVDITLSATDMDGDSLTYTIVDEPAHGTVTLDGTINIAAYTPTANYNGADSFTFKATDDTVESNVATLTILVSAVNDAPVLNTISDVTINETETATIELVASDPDGDNSLTFSNSIHMPVTATFNETTKIFTWVTTYDTVKYKNSKTFTGKITVTDSGGLSDNQTVNITVINKNRAPELLPISNITISEGGTFTLYPKARDIDKDQLTFVYQDVHSSFVGGDGTWRVSTSGIYNLNVSVVDSGGLYDNQSVTIYVLGMPPKLFVVNPVDNAELNSRNLKVSGMVHDVNLGSLTLLINGTLSIDLIDNVSDFSTGGGWFEQDITLVEGMNELVFNASDEGGLSTTVARTVIINLSKTNEIPVLTIEAIANITSENNVTAVRGYVTDDSGVPKVVVSINGMDKVVGVSKYGYFGTNVNLALGLNTITVTATDAGGETDTKTLVVNYTYEPPVDLVNPILILTYPPKGLEVGSDKLLVTGYAADNVGIKNVTVNGAEVTSLNGVFSKEVTLSEGDNTITVIATDTSGNNVIRTRTVMYDKTDAKDGLIKVEKISLSVSHHSLYAGSGNISNVTAFATDIDGRPANDSENVTFVVVTNNGFTCNEIKLENGTAILSVIATEEPQTIIVIASNDTMVLASTQVVIKPDIEIKEIMNDLSITVDDFSAGNSGVVLLDGIINIRTDDSNVSLRLIENDDVTLSVDVGAGSKLEIKMKNVSSIDRSNLTGEVCGIILNNRPIRTDFTELNETVGKVTIDVNVEFKGNAVPGTLTFEMSGHRTIEDVVSSIGAVDADVIKENIAKKLKDVYKKNADKTHVDNGVAAIIHAKLDGASNDDIKNVPISLTLNLDWFNNVAGGNADNVKVFEINESTGGIEAILDCVVVDNGDGTVTISAIASGFSSYAFTSITTAPDIEDEGNNDDGTTTSSGGSSGGGSSGEAYENIALKDAVQRYLSVNNPVEYTFTDESNPILNVAFTPLINKGYVTVMVEVLKNTSGLVSTPASGLVYENMNIWVGSAGWANEQTISNAEIHFKVDKNWIKQNNVDSGDIILVKYHDEKWTQLPTTETSDDSENVYYSAKTTEFSPFAIIAKTADGVEVAVPVPPTEPEAPDEAEPAIPIPPEDEEKTGVPGFEAIGAFGMIAVVYFMRRRKV